MKKVKLRKEVKIALLLLLFIVFAFTIYRLGVFYFDLYKNKKINNDLIKEVLIYDNNDEKAGSVKVDFDQLLKINPETKAWIRFNHELINYPVVQRKNNVYYLYRAIDGSVNSAGTIFMDYRNQSIEDRNVVLYGHNMVDRTMFGSLEDVFQEGFFDLEDNHFIDILLPGDISYRYQIFSYYIIEKEEYYITTAFSNDDAYLKFLKDMQQRSEQGFDVSLNSDDKVLTLSTCEGTGGTTKRKVIHAKRIN